MANTAIYNVHVCEENKMYNKNDKYDIKYVTIVIYIRCYVVLYFISRTYTTAFQIKQITCKWIHLAPILRLHIAPSVL